MDKTPRAVPLAALRFSIVGIRSVSHVGQPSRTLLFTPRARGTLFAKRTKRPKLQEGKWRPTKDEPKVVSIYLTWAEVRTALPMQTAATDRSDFAVGRNPTSALLPRKRPYCASVKT